MLKKYRNDLLLALVVLAVAVGILVFRQVAHEKAEGTLSVSIYEDGDLLGMWTPEGNETICIIYKWDEAKGGRLSECDYDAQALAKLIGSEAGYNVILIQNDQVDVTDADCRDKICVSHVPIGQKNDSIICLPHHLVVSANRKGNQSGNIDAVTW